MDIKRKVIEKMIKKYENFSEDDAEDFQQVEACPSCSVYRKKPYHPIICSSECLSLVGDKKCFEQEWYNLLVNAIDKWNEASEEEQSKIFDNEVLPIINKRLKYWKGLLK